METNIFANVGNRYTGSRVVAFMESFGIGLDLGQSVWCLSHLGMCFTNLVCVRTARSGNQMKSPLIARGWGGGIIPATMSGRFS